MISFESVLGFYSFIEDIINIKCCINDYVSMGFFTDFHVSPRPLMPFFVIKIKEIQ